MPVWIIQVPARPGGGRSTDAFEDYGAIEAPNEALARQFASPIVRWESSRLVAVACTDATDWATVNERVRYDALQRMSASLLNRDDRALLQRVARKRPVRG